MNQKPSQKTTWETSGIRFGPDGLVPVVVQEWRTGHLLMVAYMNLEALEATLKTGWAHYWSRSRNRLWKKGETSGHLQRVRALWYDCDADTLLLQVEQEGVACHTGAPSCFYRVIHPSQPDPLGIPGGETLPPPAGILDRVARVIRDRQHHPRERSYVSGLFQAGQDRILHKVAEEAGEVLLASKNGDSREILHEVADLWFHTLVLLQFHGLGLADVYQELENRWRKTGKASPPKASEEDRRE